MPLLALSAPGGSGSTAFLGAAASESLWRDGGTHVEARTEERGLLKPRARPCSCPRLIPHVRAGTACPRCSSAKTIAPETERGTWDPPLIYSFPTLAT